MTASQAHSRRGLYAWAIVGLTIHAALVGCLFMVGLRPASFVHFGDGSPSTALSKQVLGPRAPSAPGGGDGVAFWVLARDPALANVARYLDRPSYRADRIGYALLAAPGRLFGEGGVLWGLIVANLLAAALGTWAAAGVADLVGAPRRAALTFALCPGVLIATWLDVADGLALALLLATMVMVWRRRWVVGVACAVAAVLTKEVILAPLAGLTLLGLPKDAGRQQMALLAIPAGAVGAWALYVRTQVGWPAQEGTDIVSPGLGYLRVWRHDMRYATDLVSQTLAIGLLVVAVAAIGLGLRRRTIASAAAIPMAIVVLCFGPYVVGRYNNSLRAGAPLLTFVALDLYARYGASDGRGIERRT